MSYDHFSKNLEINKTGGGFKKRSQAASFFSFILISFYHFTFGITVHCISIKKTEQKHHFKCPNLILNYQELLFYTFGAFIPNIERNIYVLVI